MALHRRTLLRGGSVVAAASLSGCSALAELLAGEQHYEYSLTVDAVDRSLIGHALFEPEDGSPFDRSARDALEAILPDGRHTTYGFEPVPAGAYVEHDGRYFQTMVVVTGRERMDRKHVRARPIESGVNRSDDLTLEDLSEVGRRVVEILHVHHTSRGPDSSSDLLHGDAYVLRRPVELDDAVADALDGEYVRVDADGHWRYRLVVSEESVTEPVYQSFAVEVAPNREAFRDVALATRVDAVVDPSDLERPARDLLEATIEDGRYQEETPLSGPFTDVIERLGVADVTVAENGLFLWYDETLYRYGLYVHPLN